MAAAFYLPATLINQDYTCDLLYCRYSDRFMETRCSTLVVKAPPTSAGNRQRTRLKHANSAWVRNHTFEELKAAYFSQGRKKLMAGDSV